MQEQEGRKPHTVNTDTPVLGLLPTCYVWSEEKERVFKKCIIFEGSHSNWLVGTCTNNYVVW